MAETTVQDELVRATRSYQAYAKSPFLSVKHTTYFPVYDRLFAPYADKEVTFVEIGVLNGGSLFMWREFFGPKARIIGVELNPIAERWREEGFEIAIGDQSDPEFWRRFYAQYGEIDLLLDDGGHTFEQQIVTVESALPHMRDGGLIVVEDAHTSYMGEFGGPSRSSFVGYAGNVIDGINRRFSAFVDDRESEPAIYAVHAYESIIAFEVDRRLAGIRSAPTSNGGQPIGARDFRYADMAGEDVASQADRQGAGKAKLGLAGRLQRSAMKRLRPLRNRLRSLKLRRYFKY